MATSTDVYCSTPQNTADGAWYRSGDYRWNFCVAATSDAKNARCENDSSNYGDDGRDFSGWGLTAIPTYCKINSVTVVSYAGRSGLQAGTMKHGINLSGGTMTWSSSFAPTGAWYSFSPSRPGGGSWARSDLANIRYRMHANGDETSNRQIYVDCILLRINWDYITLTSLTAGSTSVGSTTATLTGSYNANGDGDTEYRLMYKVSGGSYDDPAWTAGSGTGSITCNNRSLTGLSSGTTYYYKLQARNTANTVQESSEGNFTTAVGVKGSRMMVMG